MLSYMNTPNGMTVIGPTGKPLRISRSSPAYQAGQSILNMEAPAEQRWGLLEDLVASPLQVLVDWCVRYGLSLKDEEDTLCLEGVSLCRTAWLPLLNRTQIAGASPAHLHEFAKKLGDHAAKAQVGNVCLHLQEDKLAGWRPGLLKLMCLPVEARPGDIVTEASSGPAPFLVRFDEILVNAAGVVQPVKGIVLQEVSEPKAVTDVLAQPAILGFNRTYQCEEGSKKGWLTDLSFDSLKAARGNAKDIQDSGAEARIINRITGETVPLQ